MTSPLVPNALYRRDALCEVLGVGKNTLTTWIADGLDAYGVGCRTDLFFSDDVIEFLRKQGPKTKHRKGSK